MVLNVKGFEGETELNGGEENLNLKRVEVSAIEEREIEREREGVNHTYCEMKL